MNQVRKDGMSHAVALASSGGTARMRAEKNALTEKIVFRSSQGEAAVNHSDAPWFNVQK